MTREARDKYLRRNYGITVEEYEKMLKVNDGGCWICGSKPKTRSLAVDHDHKIEKAKLTIEKTSYGFRVSCPEFIGTMTESFDKKSAVDSLRRVLLKKSCRGLLCPACNTGLKKFRDNSAFLTNASLYIERYKGGLNKYIG